MKFASTLAFGAALLTAGAAFAQPGPGPDGRPGRGGPDRGARMLELFDANRDGRVTWDEAWVFVTTRFTTADADRSGGLSLQEFATMRMRPANAPTPPAQHAARIEEMRGRMFRGLDANRDGQVTLVEIQPFAEARFRAMDANADGAVTAEELPQRGMRGHHGMRGRGPGPGMPGTPGAPGAPAAPATR